MDLLSILLLAVGLAMDAFSVSITRGLSVRCDIKHALTIALFFGGFQALMPVLGWASGRELASFMSQWAPWVAFILLGLVGVKMIYESFRHPEEDACEILSLRELLFLSVATSIDAFAVGVTFAFLNISLLQPIIIIGLVTFILSLVGVYIGKQVGHLFESKIEIVGGIILIAIGFKILLENLL
ncbi:manganese efflux pump [Methanobacterium sp. CWC-01]|uniref:manganese efflux pump MntP n=1 Tax=Methanobacterium aridiramus TaxID=2584467 RepID=UPI002575DF19|nr:manganese efflux pump MntP family protein [Methanobacterium sp. CWC-01]WJI08627.1 manganese efflux pump [Methanobacterium sp. CWC-01]